MDISLSSDKRYVTLSGTLTEHDDLSELSRQLDGDVRVDASGLTRINSSGVRQWMNFIRQLPPTAHLTFENCAVGFVLQMNMVDGFVGQSKVASIRVPYLCKSCGAASEPVLSLDALARGVPPSTGPCPHCAGPLEVDVAVDEYLVFLRP
jgi:hypothetical protein